MQVKIFEAPDMATGLRQIRRELGPDALILSTRTVKNGKLGLLGKNTLEITAAIDTPWPDRNSPSAEPLTPIAGNLYNRSGNMPTEQEERGTAASSFTPAPAISNQTPSAAQHAAEGGPETPALRQEVDELRSLVKNLAGEISRLGNTKTSSATQTLRSVTNNLEDRLRSSRRGSKVEGILLAQGINLETSRTISSYAEEHLTAAELDDVQKVTAFLQQTIADLLTVNPPDFSVPDFQKRIALVGPTGVGKTTTLAKIAARYLASHSNAICFITIDTYRIAAVEQLKVYGEIMHLPVEVVLTPQQLRDALEKHSQKELILIDTAGRSPRDSLSIEEIQTFFTPDLNIESHLVLSATTRDNELMDTYSQFQNIPVHNTIFTKTDECTTLGTLLNIQLQNGNPFSYITNGQRVPEDIMEADKHQLAQLIIPTPFGKVHD